MTILATLASNIRRDGYTSRDSDGFPSRTLANVRLADAMVEDLTRVSALNDRHTLNDRHASAAAIADARARTDARYSLAGDLAAMSDAEFRAVVDRCAAINARGR